MFRCTRAIVLAAALAGATSASAGAVRTGPATFTVVAHHVDVHPSSERAARVALDRLGDAAMEACGASSFSLREVKADVRASPCWRRSMTDAVAGIKDPMLDAAYARRGTGR